MSIPAVQKRLSTLAELREALAAFGQVPAYEDHPDYYQDWGEEGEFKVQVGKGECAV